MGALQTLLEQARGQTLVEVVAVATGAASVLLAVRRSVWNWPLGIVNSVLFVWVFWGARLYPDALLNVYFTAMSLYGWCQWAQGKRPEEGLHVRLLGANGRAGLAGLIALGALGLGLFLERGLGLVAPDMPPAALPYPEALIFMLSLCAQALMARRVLECWVLWIIVDLVAIPVYVLRELYFVAALYGLFLVLATSGLVSWVRAWRRQSRIAA